MVIIKVIVQVVNKEMKGDINMYFTNEFTQGSRDCIDFITWILGFLLPCFIITFTFLSFYKLTRFLMGVLICMIQ